jgi:hypothetical protein
VQTYTDALEDHILPALGDYYYDQMMSTDVQKWIARSAAAGAHRALSLRGSTVP